MQYRFTILLFVILLFGVANITSACNNSTSNGSSTSEDPATGGVEDPTPQEVQLTLSADGDSANTYQLIEDAGYGNEAPDVYNVHTSEQHITQTYDTDLGRYVFNFHIHIDEDDDRGIATTTDRQRNEIKTDSSSPDELLGFDGETVKYHWYFKLPEGMLTTTAFTHIHQIKGIDNDAGTADVSNPVITFTVRTKSSAQQFEVRYYAPTEDNASTEYLGSFALSEMLGEWVEVTECLTYSTSGSYSLLITRLSDGEELLNIPTTSLKTARDGSPAMRPKWGIYRNFGDDGCNKDQLRDETLLFADFNIEKQ